MREIQIASSWTAYLFVAMLALYALSSKRDFSLLVTIITVLICDLLLDKPISIFLSQFQTSLSPVLYKTAVYFGYTLSDLIAVFGILQLHKLYHEPFGTPAKLAVYGLMLLGLLQMTAFVFSFFIPRQTFLDIYVMSNSTLYLSIQFMLVAFVVKDVLPGKFSIKWEKES